MKSAITTVLGSWLARVGLLALLVFAPSANATVQIVLFGVDGFTYTPAFFTATVGDTVRWQGDFSFHPLSSTSVPAGADSWHNGSGTTFDYVIKVAGTYNYQCDNHAPAMVGSFSAVLTGLSDGTDQHELRSFRLEQNYPNPFNPATVISYWLPEASVVKLVVYNLLGGEVAILADGVMAAGRHEVRYDATGLASGVYLYRLSAGKNVETRKLTLMR